MLVQNSPKKIYIYIMTNISTIVSAPGKVLIAGGYVVLDPRCTGLVIATEARFYAKVQDQHWKPSTATDGLKDDLSRNKISVLVKSPQFSDAVWNYSIHYDGNDIRVTFDSTAMSRNPFVEAALKCTMAYYLAKQSEAPQESLVITVNASNDFYSQSDYLKSKGLEITADALQSLPRFNCLDIPIDKVSKTGLGSSAAMVTSLIGSLMVHLGLASTANGAIVSGLTSICRLAHIAHSIAQGKIGSGFDISAATYGSHTYKRFSPSILDHVLSSSSDPDVNFTQSLVRCVDGPWDLSVEPCRLPKGLVMMLGDIRGGSNTPKLVSTVLEWKRNNPVEAEDLWIQLDGLNVTLCQLFLKLDKLSSQFVAEYIQVLQLCGSLSFPKWKTLLTSNIETNDVKRSVVETLLTIRETFQSIRALLRTLTVLTGTPIEPSQQTRILDACSEVPGVLIAGIPGAGGFDAIFCIVLSEDAKHRVESLWQTWKPINIVPLIQTEANEGILVESNGLF